MKHTPKRSGSRCVGYKFGFDSQIEFAESEMEKVLEAAKKAGVVTEFDTGRGNCVWFNGYPGKEMREVRKQVLAVIADYPRWYEARWGTPPPP